MTLAPADAVVSLDVVSSGTHLMCVTDKGHGKRTPLRDFRLQNRGGAGIRAMRLTAKIGAIVGVRVVTEADDVMMITSSGILIRMHGNEVPSLGRSTQGVTLMRPMPGDEVAALARIVAEEDE